MVELGLQEPKVGFKLHLLIKMTEKQCLKGLHLPEQVATRATVGECEVERDVALVQKSPDPQVSNSDSALVGWLRGGG